MFVYLIRWLPNRFSSTASYSKTSAWQMSWQNISPKRRDWRIIQIPFLIAVNMLIVLLPSLYTTSERETMRSDTICPIFLIFTLLPSTRRIPLYCHRFCNLCYTTTLVIPISTVFALQSLRFLLLLPFLFACWMRSGICFPPVGWIDLTNLHWMILVVQSMTLIVYMIIQIVIWMVWFDLFWFGIILY